MDETLPETLVTRWQEPEQPRLVGVNAGMASLGCLGGSIVFLCVAIWKGDLNFYLAAAALLAASGAIASQKKDVSGAREIVITTKRVAIGTREFAIGELAGFWVETDDDILTINFEAAKPTLLSLIHI
jgi:hypothetical protein